MEVLLFWQTYMHPIPVTEIDNVRDRVGHVPGDRHSEWRASGNGRECNGKKIWTKRARTDGYASRVVHTLSRFAGKNPGENNCRC
jgi:hypothetical protein